MWISTICHWLFFYKIVQLYLSIMNHILSIRIMIPLHKLYNIIEIYICDFFFCGEFDSVYSWHVWIFFSSRNSGGDSGVGYVPPSRHPRAHQVRRQRQVSVVFLIDIVSCIFTLQYLECSVIGVDAALFVVIRNNCVYRIRYG